MKLKKGFLLVVLFIANILQVTLCKVHDYEKEPSFWDKINIIYQWKRFNYQMEKAVLEKDRQRNREAIYRRG